MTGDVFGVHAVVVRLRVSIHARRVTGDLAADGADHLHFVSIHARRVTGDGGIGEVVLAHGVSIHARRVTGDTACFEIKISIKEFQFTPVV